MYGISFDVAQKHHLLMLLKQFEPVDDDLCRSARKGEGEGNRRCL